MMGTWHCKDIGDGVAAYESTQEIKDAFLASFMAAHGQYDMALFSRYDKKRNIVTVYFSPAAELIARAFGAVPCDKPPLDDLGLLVGDLRSWDMLFPGQQIKERP